MSEYWNRVDLGDRAPRFRGGRGNEKKQMLMREPEHWDHPFSMNLMGVDSQAGRSIPESWLLTARRKARQVSVTGTVGPMLINARVLHTVGRGFSPLPSPDSSLFNGDTDKYRDWQRMVGMMFRFFLKHPVNLNGSTSNLNDLWNIAQTALIDGDCFVIFKVNKDKQKRTGCGVCWKIVGGASVCNPNGDINTDKIRNGIEYDSFGAAVAIHALMVNENGYRWWEREPIYTQHGEKVVFQVRFPSLQVSSKCDDRGIPWLLHVVNEINILEKYRVATAVKATIESKLVKVIESPVDDDIPSFGTEIATEGPNGEISFQEMQDGISYKTLPGEKISPIIGSAASPNYASFSEALLREICAACDFPPEVALKSFNSNFTAHMGSRNEVVRRQEADRAEIFPVIDQLYAFFVDNAVRSGKIVAPGYIDSPEIRDSFVQLKWAVPPEGAINPIVEAKASAIHEDRGWCTKADNASQYGRDYNALLPQRKVEAQEESEILPKDALLQEKNTAEKAADKNV